METNKIKMRTIRKQADVQVIELDVAFIARVIEAKIAAEDIVHLAEYRDEYEYTMRENELDNARLLLNLLTDINAAFLANVE